MCVFVCKRHFWWRHIWRYLHVTMLPSWATFSNGLVHWNIRMICTKNYETASKFVKVMPSYCGLFFSGHGVVVNSGVLMPWNHPARSRVAAFVRKTGKRAVRKFGARPCSNLAVWSVCVAAAPGSALQEPGSTPMSWKLMTIDPSFQRRSPCHA